MFPPDSSLSLDLALHIKVWAVYINLGVQPALARGDKTRERIFCWFLETAPSLGRQDSSLKEFQSLPRGSDISKLV